MEAVRCPGEEEVVEVGRRSEEGELASGRGKIYWDLCLLVFLVFSVVVFVCNLCSCRYLCPFFCLNFYLYSAPAPPYCRVQFFSFFIEFSQFFRVYVLCVNKMMADG